MENCFSIKLTTRLVMPFELTNAPSTFMCLNRLYILSLENLWWFVLMIS
jgi:hypothetical protein